MVTYRNSFVTDLQVSKDNVAEVAACGRAGWKIENDSFNMLKTKGYNLEHNFGNGRQHLAAVLATMNLLAFVMRSLISPTRHSRRAPAPTSKACEPSRPIWCSRPA